MGRRKYVMLAHSPARQRFTLGRSDAVRFEEMVVVNIVGMNVFGPRPLALSIVIFLLGHVASGAQRFMQHRRSGRTRSWRSRGADYAPSGDDDGRLDETLQKFGRGISALHCGHVRYDENGGKKRNSNV